MCEGIKERLARHCSVIVDLPANLHSGTRVKYRRTGKLLPDVKFHSLLLSHGHKTRLEGANRAIYIVSGARLRRLECLTIRILRVNLIKVPSPPLSTPNLSAEVLYIPIGSVPPNENKEIRENPCGFTVVSLVQEIR